jgi:hypothetical protein
LNLEERLIRDAKSFAAEATDFDEEELIARVYKTLGISVDDSASNNSPAAGHTQRPAEPKRI